MFYGAIVPTRPLGNTGIEVPVIAVGLGSTERLFYEAFMKYGLTYWDTSVGYGGGKAETGLGEFFANNPDVREKVFMVTKSEPCIRHQNQGIERIEEEFNTSYQRFGNYTTGQMGAAVGYAASICKKYNASPRDVYQKHLDELIKLVLSSNRYIHEPRQ